MTEDTKLVMVTVSGKDRPGISSALSRVLLEHNVELVDIEQASLQDLLGLSFLVDLSNATGSKDSVIKDLLFEASQLDLNLNFRLFSENELKAISKKNLYILTYFGGIRALAELSKILAEESVNIETISNLTHHEPNCVEMTINVNETTSLTRLKERIMAKSHELDTDLALQKMEAYRKNKRLIFFDMDCTLVDIEIIDEMARRAGVYREVARITEKAMRDELDFEESLIQRVALLKGLNVSELHAMRESMYLSDGVEAVIATLKHLGYMVGVVTGGFDFFSSYLREKLDLDFDFANRLEIKNNALTGQLVGAIIDSAQKARIVNKVATDHGILLDQVVAVGDGANDALMLGQAGLGIAYNAKKGLERVVSASLGRARFMNILSLLGITEEDMINASGRNTRPIRLAPC